MCEVYGATETSPVASITPWGGQVKPGTVGVPVPDTDIKIVDLDTGDNELPLGESGEILIKGPQVMQGYYKKPDWPLVCLPTYESTLLKKRPVLPFFSSSSA